MPTSTETIKKPRRWKIFISYCSDRKEEAVDLSSFLKEKTIDVTISVPIRQLAITIAEFELAIIFASPAYRKCDNCHSEANLILDYKKPLILINLPNEVKGDVDLSSAWFIGVKAAARMTVDWPAVADRAAFRQQFFDDMMHILRPKPNKLQTVQIPLFEDDLYYERRDDVDGSVLAAICEACRHPEQGICLILGESGIGKTMTVAHVLNDPKHQQKMVDESDVEVVIWINCYGWAEQSRRNNGVDAENWLTSRIIAAAEKVNKRFGKFETIYQVASYFHNHQPLYVLDSVVDAKLVRFFMTSQQQYRAPCCVIARDLNIQAKFENETVNKTVTLNILQEEEISDMMMLVYKMKEKIPSERKILQLANSKNCWGLPLIAGLVCSLFVDQNPSHEITFNKIVTSLESITTRTEYSKEQLVAKTINQLLTCLFEKLTDREMRLYYAFLFFDPGVPISREDIALLWGKTGDQIHDTTVQIERFARRNLLRYESHPVNAETSMHQMIHSATLQYAATHHDLPIEPSIPGKSQDVEMFLAEIRFLLVNGFACETKEHEKTVLFEAVRRKRSEFVKDVIEKLKVADLAQVFLRHWKLLPEDKGAPTFLHFLFNFANFPNQMRLIYDLLMRIKTSGAVGLLKQVAMTKSVEENGNSDSTTFVDSLFKKSDSWPPLLKIMSPWKFLYDGRKWRNSKMTKHGNSRFIEAAFKGKFEDVTNCFNPKMPFSELYDGFLAAATCDSIETIDFLGKRMPSLFLLKDEDSEDEFTVLHVAVKSSSLEVVRFLLDRKHELFKMRLKSTGDTVLHCVQHGDVAMAACLLQADRGLFTCRNEANKMAIHVAAENGDRHLVSFYVKQNSFALTSKSENGKTALHFAAAEGHIGVVHDLVEAGGVEVLSLKDDDEKTAFHLAAAEGQLHVVHYLAEKDPSLVWLQDKTGKTALHLATFNGHQDVVKYIVRKGPKLLYVGTIDTNRQTALHVAATKGFFNIAQELVAVDPAIILMEDCNRENAMALATCNGHLDLVRFFLEKNPESASKQKLLNYAVGSGNIDLIRHVAETFPQQITKESLEEALLTVAALGRIEVIEFMLEKWPELRTNAAERALRHATKRGVLKTVRYLVQKSPGFLSQMDSKEYTTLHLAAYNGHLETVRYLCEVNPCLMSKAGPVGGVTALHLAAKMNEKAVVSFMIELDPSVIRQADKVNKGWTALHYAASEGHTDSVRLLIEKDPSVVHLWDHEGNLPSQLAEEKGHKVVAKYLSQLEETTEIVTIDISVRLQMASRDGNLAVVRELVEEAPDLVVKKDNRGLTPADYAAANEYSEIVCFLVERDGTGYLVQHEFSDGQNVLHFAAKAGNAGLFLSLIDKYPVYLITSDYRGISPCQLIPADILKFFNASVLTKALGIFHESVRDGNADLVCRIVDYNQKWITFGESACKLTAIDYAIGGGQLNLLRYFLLKDPTALSKTRGSGAAALCDAAKFGHIEVVKFLLKKEPSLITASFAGDNGSTALHAAASAGKMEVVTLLANKYPTLVNVEDNEKNTPAVLAEKNGHKEVASFLVSKRTSDSLKKDIAVK